MKELKSNNKGFSLVELIVVVLIMAIIAVALAPQVLKWVNNSRISSDQNTMQQVISNFQTALTNEKAFDEVKGKCTDAGTLLLEIKNCDGTNDTAWTSTATDADFGNLKAKFLEYSGTTTITDFKTKVTNNVIKISITKAGKVIGEQTATNANSIDN